MVRLVAPPNALLTFSYVPLQEAVPAVESSIWQMEVRSIVTPPMGAGAEGRGRLMGIGTPRASPALGCEPSLGNAPKHHLRLMGAPDPAGTRGIGKRNSRLGLHDAPRPGDRLPCRRAASLDQDQMNERIAGSLSFRSTARHRRS